MSLMCNKNVDIKFSAHDAFLEWPSSGTLKIEKLESHIKDYYSKVDHPCLYSMEIYINVAKNKLDTIVRFNIK